MKILFILNYYYPNTSGLTEHVRLLAEQLAQNKKYEITILCSNHANLPNKEIINNVNIVRTNIWFKISKGIISPSFIFIAKKLSKQNDIVNLHLPMIESGLISTFLPKEKLLTTYHCDVDLEKKLINNLILKVMDYSNNRALKKSKKIIVTTKEYAMTSRISYKYIDKMIEIVPPIIETSRTKEYKENNVIGFAGRIVEEKGIFVLLKAFKLVQKEIPDVSLKLAGEHSNVPGGSIYNDVLKFIEKENIESVKFLGNLKKEKLLDFYSSINVLALPSINSLEAFGTVQVEAMKCGVPVVSSDLPGVKTVVQKTGMGLIVKKGNKKDLAKALIKILKKPQNYIKSKNFIDSLYSLNVTVREYEKVFKIYKK